MLALEQRFHNAITRFFEPKLITMASAGAIRGEYLPDGGVQVHMVVALDLLYWAMRSASYRLICMAIGMAHEGGAFFSVIDFMSCITVAK
jgi:hypothetical protein